MCVCALRFGLEFSVGLKLWLGLGQMSRGQMSDSGFYFISAVDRANYVVATTSVVRRRNHLNRPDRPVA